LLTNEYSSGKYINLETWSAPTVINKALTQKSFTHGDTVKITGLSSRTIINWSERSLIEANVEASGQGSKRLYSYSNLLEFALSAELFDMGLGIQAVRNLLKGLRADGSLQLWVENFESYYRKMSADFHRWFTSTHEEYPAEPSLNDGSSPYVWPDYDLYKKIKPERDIGILVVAYKRSETVRVIVPFGLDESIKRVFNYRDINESSKILIVDLAKVKSRIDHRILLALE
jgi:DNA-binding transcriptional MerR regulator